VFEWLYLFTVLFKNVNLFWDCNLKQNAVNSVKKGENVKTAAEREKIGDIYKVFDSRGQTVGQVKVADVTFSAINGRPVLCLRGKNRTLNQFGFTPEAAVRFFVQTLGKDLGKMFKSYYANGRPFPSFDDFLTEVMVDAEVPCSHENHKEYSIRFFRNEMDRIEVHIVFGWSQKIILKSYAYEIGF
jgi:hypothetical protein